MPFCSSSVRTLLEAGALELAISSGLGAILNQEGAFFRFISGSDSVVCSCDKKLLSLNHNVKSKIQELTLTTRHSVLTGICTGSDAFNRRVHSAPPFGPIVT